MIILTKRVWVYFTSVYLLCVVPLTFGSVMDYLKHLKKDIDVVGDALLHQAKEVCFGDLGCLDMGDPWVSLTRPMPAPHTPELISTAIYCHTRREETRFNVTLWPTVRLNGCPFNGSRPTVFIVHGFFSSANEPWVAQLKDAYLAAQDVNVFLVDWGKAASDKNYLQCVSDIRVVAMEVSRFIRWLEAHERLHSADLHLIGHSLGAHLFAYVSNTVPGVRWITALDPARPYFEGYDPRVRLSSKDAQFVESIHTNGHGYFGFGFGEPIGQLDFYVNGGLFQPLCPVMEGSEIGNIKKFMSLLQSSLDELTGELGCSHGRSFTYYTESLRNNCTFWGRRAEVEKSYKLFRKVESQVLRCSRHNCVPMGLSTIELNATGTYEVTTLHGPDSFCDINLCNRINAEMGISQPCHAMETGDTLDFISTTIIPK